MEIATRIDGLQELARACRELPDRIGRSALRQATSAGAKLVRDDAKTKAPIYTGPVSQGHPPPGTLRKQIYMKRDNGSSGPQKQVFIVAVRSGKKFQSVGKKGANQDAYYWRFVEFGTVKMTARPYLRPAFEAQKMNAVTAIANVLRERIDAEARNLNRK